MTRQCLSVFTSSTITCKEMHQSPQRIGVKPHFKPESLAVFYTSNSELFTCLTTVCLLAAATDDQSELGLVCFVWWSKSDHLDESTWSKREAKNANFVHKVIF